MFMIPSAVSLGVSRAGRASPRYGRSARTSFVAPDALAIDGDVVQPDVERCLRRLIFGPAEGEGLDLGGKLEEGLARHAVQPVQGRALLAVQPHARLLPRHVEV